MTHFKLLLAALAAIISLNLFSQTSCESPVVIPSASVILDTLQFDVSQGSAYSTFTVPENGYIHFSACGVSPSQDDRLKVYLNSCDNLIATETDNIRCVRNSKWESVVSAGDTYIFEWDVDPSGGSTSTQINPAFFYHAGYQGYNCASSETISCLGEFETDFRRVDQWFRWIAPSTGTFEMGLAPGHDRGGDNALVWMEVHHGNGTCGNMNLVGFNDPTDEFDFEESIAFAATADETYYFFFAEYGGPYTSQFGTMQIVEQGVDPITEYSHEVSACLSYQFDGATLTASGEYQGMFLSEAGCDSLVNLTLNISQPEEHLFETSACGSFIFDDQELTASGDYQAVFQNVAGCDSTVTLNLTVVNHDLSISANETTLTVAELKGTYQWYNCASGAAVLNANQQSFTPSSTGEYKVEVSDQGCTQLSECTAVNVVTSTSLLERIAVFPNPTDGLTTVSISSERGMMRIRDISGKMLAEYDLLNGENELNISGSPGIYFLEVSVLGSTELIRVLKK